MLRTTKRDTAEQRLARLLDSPLLARVVPHLTPETLHQLIRHRGLDACGELVSAATPAQLTSVLDLDLWRHAQRNHTEQFDADRFGEWLEVLVDTGESVAARIVAALDRDLVILGLARHLRVFDPGTFEPTESSDDEPIDRHEQMNGDTSGDAVECEVGGYLVRARRTDAWDAIVTLLAALETGHAHAFHAVMQGCRRLSNSSPEIDGLDDLLVAPEQHLHDVAVERERRRSHQGYATAADARAFLQMARTPRTVPHAGNPLATAYFRALEEDEETPPGSSTSTAAPEGAAHWNATDLQARDDGGVPPPIESVIELLTGAGVIVERPLALPAAAAEDPRAAKLALLRPSMALLRQHDETAYLTRTRELAFLANTLMAGSSIQARPFTPGEASDAAACICNLGLECWPTALPDAFLVDHDLVAVFEAGWSVLYRDVSLFVADQLVAALTDLPCADAGIRRELYALQRRLVKQREAGALWLARDAADVLATLDMTAWISVLGLLDECPIVPAALTAVLERRTTGVSQTAFEFISTSAQIGDIRVFMRTLPGLLSR